ncbi:MAG: zinc-ribbon domain-containing protein [Clostridia bacterium]|nr:zinc-ribbon domain-containing protein [Clostridia bacterium]
MAFCPKCGAQVEEGVKICPTCGENLEPKTEDVSAKVAELTNTADYTATYDPNDIQNNKVMAILAYLSWLVLIPLFAAKDSPFARFHVKQGLLLAIAEIVVAIVFSILTSIVSGIFVLWLIFTLIQAVCNIFFFVISIMGIINAAQGKAKELPIVGKLKILDNVIK